MIAPAGKGTAGTVDVLVIGAGHAGLAMSRHLSARGIDHVVLERGEVANSWRHERWDSLRLLTPNWLAKLPGKEYGGADPDGYMDMRQVIDYISDYAASFSAPVYNHTRVLSVSVAGSGYRIDTDRGQWRARVVVLANGACNRAHVPAISASIPGAVRQITPIEYRNPQQLEEGGVLVVGASATGIQLAEEIHQSGRPVTLAVGEHVRLPRLYRGRDIQWWMTTIGLMDERLEMVDDINRVRHLPSPQLIGSAERRSLDLNVLSGQGVRLAGRLAGISNNKAQFSGSLRNICALADLKMARLLDSVDEWIEAYGYASGTEDRERPGATIIPNTPAMSAELGRAGIRTVLWATGYKPDYSWLKVPVLNNKGCINHCGGVVESPGLYALGLPFLRRRKSTFIHGADDDARELCTHLAGYLDSIAASESTFPMLSRHRTGATKAPDAAAI